MNISKGIFFLIITVLLFPRWTSPVTASGGYETLFNEFTIEGVRIGLGFEEAIAIAESRGYTRTAPNAKHLMKKEADGSRKNLTIDPAISDTDFPQYRIVWRVAYSKSFPLTVNFDPAAVMQDLKAKYGEPSKAFDANRGARIPRSTMIYFRDKDAPNNNAAQIRFEAVKTRKQRVFNVSIHDVEIKEQNHSRYFEEKTKRAEAVEKAKPKPKIDF